MVSKPEVPRRKIAAMKKALIGFGVAALVAAGAAVYLTSGPAAAPAST